MKRIGITELQDDFNIASRYIEENYNKLVSFAGSKVGEHMANDVVNDVYVSVLKAERNGEGFDESKGNIENITLEQFIYSRIKLYCMNERYRGNEYEIPASSNAEPEEMSGIQLAYNNASCDYDELELVDIEVSIEDNIQYLLKFNKEHNIRFMLKNIDFLTSKKFDTSILDGLKELVRFNEDITEYLLNIMEYAKAYPDKYKRIVSSL